MRGNYGGTLSLISLGLLLLFGCFLIFMPKSDYNRIIAGLEAFDDRMVNIEVLAAESFDQSDAQTNTILEQVSQAIELFSRGSAEISALKKSHEQLRKRLAHLEELMASTASNAAEEISEAEASMTPSVAAWLQPVELTESLRKTSDALGGSLGPVTKKLDAILDRFVEHGICSAEFITNLSPEARDEIKGLHDTCKAQLLLLKSEKHLYATQCMRDALRRGHYVDLPREDAAMASELLDTPNAVYGRAVPIKGTNLSRHFCFEDREYPRFNEIRHQQDNCGDHLVEEIARVIEAEMQAAE